MEKFLSQQFSTLDWLKDQDVALVGVGGSARNVARIHQSEHTYPIMVYNIQCQIKILMKCTILYVKVHVMS